MVELVQQVAASTFEGGAIHPSHHIQHLKYGISSHPGLLKEGGVGLPKWQAYPLGLEQCLKH